MSVPDDDPIARLRAEVVALRTERDVARAEKALLASQLANRNDTYAERQVHQAATNEVLAAMAVSPADPQPVFDLIATRARDVCGSYGVSVMEFDGVMVRLRAWTGVIDDPAVREAYVRQFPRLPDGTRAEGRAILDRRVVHVRDYQNERELRLSPGSTTVRSNVAVPMIRGTEVIGVVVMGSRDVGGFSDSQVELLKTFAEQAVIAITSAAAHREQREALEQQTATAEVLQVINSSPGELAPVFDAMLAKAMRLCEANFGSFLQYDGKLVRGAAHRGISAFDPFEPPQGGPLAQALGDGSVRQVADLRETEVYRTGASSGARHYVDVGGARTVIWAPLRKEDRSVGVMVMFRREVRPFKDKQIALLQSFAAQAVIAMENARLITEQRESLDRQTALADVLKAINSSRDDLVPVFQTILEKAHGLCGVEFGSLQTWDGEKFQAVVVHNLSPALEERLKRGYIPGPNSPGRGLIAGQSVVHIRDIGELDDPVARAVLENDRLRTLVHVALRKDQTLLGQIVAARPEVRAFTDKEIALLENFAAQAVIAMESARLITETREALEQQTATSEILRVIASSPNDVQPVFDIVVKAAVRLCGAQDSLVVMRHGSEVAFQAHEGPLGGDRGARWPLVRENVMGRAIIEGRTVHVADASALAPGEFDRTKHGVVLYGFKAIVAAPLMRKGSAIGALLLRRREAGPYTPRQIELLETFAAQAVIAIENVRLFTELRESLERQIATADILKVIASSPADTKPAFDAIAERANRLVGGLSTAVWRLEGDTYHLAAFTPTSPGADEALKATSPLSKAEGDAVMPVGSGDISEIADIENASSRFSTRLRDLARLRGYRAILFVPLMVQDTFIGFVSVTRREPGAFKPDDVQLLKTFADQAVIAIQNARLFNELNESLEQQTATGNILKAIASSPTDVQPVLDAVAKAAVRFCGTTDAIVQLRDGNEVIVAAHEGPLTVRMGQRRPIEGDATFSAVLVDGQTMHYPDIQALDAAEFALWRQVSAEAGWRAFATAPLLREGTPIGCISLRRIEPGSFTPQQIELLKTFAAQAVIAIENVRLFTELRDALEQQTATAEILRVISQSPTDVNPVLAAVAKAALKFCGAQDAVVSLLDGDYWIIAAHEGPIDAIPGPRRLNRHTAPGRAMVDGTVVQIVDLQSAEGDEYPDGRELGARSGFRSALAAPLLRDDVAIGAITLRRPEPGTFTSNQVELLKSFAAQAVIAIENVRLFTELREALDQQTATAEILRAISQSPTDVQPVLEAVVRATVRFCGAEDAVVALRDGEDHYFASAHDGPLEWVTGQRQPLDGTTALRRAMREARSFHLPDIEVADPVAFATEHRHSREFGYRAGLAAPMLREGVAIGAIGLRKREAGAIAPRQVQLLESFAAQAVIAIENVRLFTELGARNEELRDALEQQTATADILRVISQSPTDVQPVLSAVAKAALRFCGAPDALISMRDGDDWVAIAHEGTLSAVIPLRRQLSRVSASGRCILDGRPVEIVDINGADAADFPESVELARLGGWRAALAAPMLRDGVAIGSIFLRRPEPGPFTPRQLQLLEVFAAQAVIAIENVRLFTELRDALEQQTATAEILRVISQSPTDVGPVLAAVAKAAVRFCGATDTLIALRENDDVVVAAHEGPLGARIGDRSVLDPRGRGTGRAIVEGRTIHVPDVEALDPTQFVESRRLSLENGFRSFVVAPMLREGTAIGSIGLRKPDAGAFTPRQIELLETFAAQAVIAIENVRLFTELRESLERLKAAQANLIQSEKMASLGQLTAGIAHEIKNPLNFVNNFAGLSSELLDELKQAVGALIAEPDDDKRAELQDTIDLLAGNLARIVEHGRRADGIVKSMLAHSRGGTGDWQTSNINGLVEEALNLAYHGARAQDQGFNVTLERDFDEALKAIDVVPQDITRVFLNVFGNGFYATRKRRGDDSDGSYHPTLRVSTRDLGEAVEIRVRDNGTGMIADVRAKLFQPFFTTKPTGEGTGLGLSISYDVVTQQHGGTIEVESEPGQFTEFTVRLPRARRAASESKP